MQEYQLLHDYLLYIAARKNKKIFWFIFRSSFLRYSKNQQKEEAPAKKFFLKKLHTVQCSLILRIQHIVHLMCYFYFCKNLEKQPS
ncbi:MAG: hypothetical protein D3924_09835 [Candidatus Electrothrix sp. AR4]|nr:hypothetical protein [Candidatus Electrothrix sp. AR4]